MTSSTKWNIFVIALATVGLVGILCITIMGTRPETDGEVVADTPAPSAPPEREPSPATPARSAGPGHPPKAKSLLDAMREDAAKLSSVATRPSTRPAPQQPTIHDQTAAELGRRRAARKRALEGIKTPADLFKWASPAVVSVSVHAGFGRPIGTASGFFVSGDGHVVTNYHVMENATSAKVRTSDGKIHDVLGAVSVDAPHDLVMLVVWGNEMPFLDVSTNPSLEVGTPVYAIGSPQRLANTLSQGIISGIRESKTGFTILQTTAAISPGSSGGPLLTLEGKVVGVTSSSFASGQNLNFCVPAPHIRDLMENKGFLQNLMPELQADRWAEIGRRHVKEKRHREGLLAYQLAIQSAKKKSYGTLYLPNLGYCYWKLGDLEKAVAAYEGAFPLCRGNALTEMALGYVYLEMGKRDRALAAFETARRSMLTLYKAKASAERIGRIMASVRDGKPITDPYMYTWPVKPGPVSP